MAKEITVTIVEVQQWEKSPFACPQCGNKSLWYQSESTATVHMGGRTHLCIRCLCKVQMSPVIWNEGLTEKEHEILKQLSGNNT